MNICDHCGKPSILGFDVPDKIWEEVVPPPARKRILCLTCFDYYASLKGIKYMDSIEQFYLTGRQERRILKAI